jgi:hypothetical protein
VRVPVGCASAAHLASDALRAPGEAVTKLEDEEEDEAEAACREAPAIGVTTAEPEPGPAADEDAP